MSVQDLLKDIEKNKNLKIWNKQSFLDEISKTCEINKDYEILNNENDTISLNIKTFKAAENIGVDKWELSYDEDIFESNKIFGSTNYTFIIDFSKIPNDKYSMVALVQNMGNEISQIYLKNNETYNNINEIDSDLNQYIERNHRPFNDLIKTIENIIKNEESCLSAGIKDFDPSNFSHIIALMENTKLYDKKISFSDMQNRLDIFDLENFKEKEFDITKTEYFSVYFESHFEDHETLKEFLDEKNYSYEDFETILKNPKVAQDFYKSTLDSEHMFLNYLNEKGDYKLYLKVLESDEFIDHLAESAGKNTLDHRNFLTKIAKNEKLIDYIKSNNKMNKLKDLGSKLEEKVNSLNNEKLSMDNYYYSAVTTVLNSKEIDILYEIVPKIKDYKTNFNEKDYLKNSKQGNIYLSDNKILDHFDFSEEQFLVDNFLEGSKRSLNNTLDNKVNYDAFLETLNYLEDKNLLNGMLDSVKISDLTGSLSNINLNRIQSYIKNKDSNYLDATKILIHTISKKDHKIDLEKLLKQTNEDIKTYKKFNNDNGLSFDPEILKNAQRGVVELIKLLKENNALDYNAADIQLVLKNNLDFDIYSETGIAKTFEGNKKTNNLKLR